MSLRWKLNASVLAMVVLFLAAASFSIRAVRRHGAHARMYSQMRAQGQFTADVRALIFQRIAVHGGVIAWPGGLEEDAWPEFLLEDVDVQIRLAHEPQEADLWTDVKRAVAELAAAEQSASDLSASVYRAEISLRRLRGYYETIQNDLSVRGAQSSVLEFVALWVACIMVTGILLVHLIMVRHWMVGPIEILRASLKAIGEGKLDHRVPLKSPDELGELARGIDAMAADLAQRQAALIEARELSAIGELCGNVAHGLRNPLATIRATAQLAERRCKGDERTAPLMHELTRQADRMDQRISKLFDFGRTVGLRPSPISFAELAGQAEAHVKPQLNEKNIRLTIEDRTRDACWRLDVGQMIESVGELVSNAIHHSEKGSNILLLGEQLPADNGSGVRLRIQVTDHGVGMDHDTLRKAFDPFFTSRQSGVGMGLPLVRRIVERHGGRIDVKSRFGEGTTMIITLADVLDDARAELGTAAINLRR